MSFPTATAHAQRGIAYLAVLLFILVLGLAAAKTGEIWRTAAQRDKEQELLFVGEQIRRAIGSYYDRTPGQPKRYPRALSDLLKDGRQVAVVRHLRRPYRDPLTLSQEWGLIKAKDGGIMGVYSLAKGQPFKRHGFPPALAEFNGRTSYAEWRFVHVPKAGGPGAGGPIGGGTAGSGAGTGGLGSGEDE